MVFLIAQVCFVGKKVSTLLDFASHIVQWNVTIRYPHSFGHMACVLSVHSSQNLKNTSCCRTLVHIPRSNHLVGPSHLPTTILPSVRVFELRLQPVLLDRRNCVALIPNVTLEENSHRLLAPPLVGPSDESLPTPPAAQVEAVLQTFDFLSRASFARSKSSLPSGHLSTLHRTDTGRVLPAPWTYN